MDKPETGTRRKSSKTQAILLAVLFGPWTWLYTYHQDKWKFWGSLIIILVGIIIAVTTPLTPPTSDLFDPEIYALSLPIIFLVLHEVFSSAISFAYLAISFGPGVELHHTYVFLLLAAVWVWAIIDSSIKPKTRYESEPAEISKKMALITAVVFSYNAWLYTYHKDKWKFWVSFGAFNLVIPLAAGLMYSCRPDPALIESGEYFDGTAMFLGFIGTVIFLGAAILLVTWLLAMLDNRPGSNKWKNFETPTPREDTPNHPPK